MARPAIFFDRDNTLIINDGYLGDPAGVILMPGAAHAIARARQMGYTTVTVSNQSGVARGMFTEEGVRAVNQRMDELLLDEDAGAVIDLHLYCPFHPQGVITEYRQESPMRKPAPGMLLMAAGQLDLDLGKSWLIGDAMRDIEAGRAAGCRTILFAPPLVTGSPHARAKTNVTPDYDVETLADALSRISQG